VVPSRLIHRAVLKCPARHYAAAGLSFLAVPLLDDDEPLLEEPLLEEALLEEPWLEAEVSPESFDDALDDPLLEPFAPFLLSVR
jgi:hypothetical protein